MRLHPFISYYGGKIKLARRYPTPQYDTIIEPFAGSAGYSTIYFKKKVILIEKYPVLAELWKYLIRADPKRIISLPDVEEGQKVRDIKGLCQEEKSLIGWWVQIAINAPRQSFNKGRNSSGTWGSHIRLHVARQVQLIRHWKVIEGEYTDAPDIKATWFIDPPYQKQGKYYICPSKDIDFDSLGKWCREREGQVMVCENQGATWLPFKPFKDAPSSRGDIGNRSLEAIWYRTDKKDGLWA